MIGSNYELSVTLLKGTLRLLSAAWMRVATPLPERTAAMHRSLVESNESEVFIAAAPLPSVAANLLVTEKLPHGRYARTGARCWRTK